jgi:hypothetical protein
MGRRLISLLVVISVLGAVVALAGCGSSKPSYCSKLTTLKQSVKSLPSTDVIKNGTSALTANVNKVVNDAHAVVDAAKSDFPNETNAITTAVDSLQTTASQLQKSASPTLVVQAASQVASLGTAVTSFSSATSPKCS